MKAKDWEQACHERSKEKPDHETKARIHWKLSCHTGIGESSRSSADNGEDNPGRLLSSIQEALMRGWRIIELTAEWKDV